MKKIPGTITKTVGRGSSINESHRFTSIRLELSYASRQLNSIEINGSFYALQSPESYQKWHDEAPDDFDNDIKTQAPFDAQNLKKILNSV